VREYEEQGDHRTGTVVDRASAEWLAAEVRRAGLDASLEAFSLERVDPLMGTLLARERRIEGLPLFDGAFTDQHGVTGRLGLLDSDAEIGLVELRPNHAAAGRLGDARRRHGHRAIVCVTRGARPGLCPSNADCFLEPFGPPVLQVASSEGEWLDAAARRGTELQLIAQVARRSAEAVNVVATVVGSDSALPPLVIMTPRSGWYRCASERGGGIACWLEIIRALCPLRARRTVHFVASSGHELGHLGIDAWVERRPGLVAAAVGWMHLGASIGAAVGPSIRLQASDDHFDIALTGALEAQGLTVTTRTSRGTVPGGEAEVVHRGGGRYVSIIGGNGLFHHPADRGPDAVDPVVMARFSQAFSVFAAQLCAS
jgi:hypothetical protein